MYMKLPEKVKRIIDTLYAHGYESYAVGGCVRDAILGRIPEDWDITTSASPYEVKELFSHTIDTGLQHGTVTVMLEHEGFEVTTYRVDGAYLDGRHPDCVVFTASLEEDLKRRDFTINAMAYNDRAGLVDLFGGCEDLNRGIIRCVGEPGERFGEDALRIMRGVRFAAQLGFDIDRDTRAAICELSGTLSKISAERIQVELVKLLTSAHPEEMRTIYETGISSVILPEFDVMMETEQNNPHHCYSVGEHTIHALKAVPEDKVLRLTMLLHDVAKPPCKRVGADGRDHFYGHPQEGAKMAREILRRLKFDNDTIAKVTSLIRVHDVNPPLEKKAVRRAVVKAGLSCYPDLFTVKRADILAQSSYKQKEKLDYVDAYEALYEEICREADCLSLKDLAVDGGDLISAGVSQGKEIGEILHRMLDAVIDDPALNEKEILMAWFVSEKKL